MSISTANSMAAAIASPPAGCHARISSRCNGVRAWKKNSFTRLNAGRDAPQERKQRARFCVRGSSSGGRELFIPTSGGREIQQPTGHRELYQPFRPPPSMVQQSVGAKSVDDMLQILRDREGLWHQYASIIPLLNRSGYSPSEIDEATGINGHEQNRLVVGSQVRASLVTSSLKQESLDWFDSGGAEILYELRILSAQQRKAAAEFVIERKMDGKKARDLAKSIKDYASRRGVVGWQAFSPSPGDCLAFSYLRQTKDARSAAEVESLINQALEYVETESARAELERALSKDHPASVEEKLSRASLTVMRLASEDIPVVLPVCDCTSDSVGACPSLPVVDSNGGPFSIHTSTSSWQRYVSVTGWKPILDAVAPVAIALPNSKMVPREAGISNILEPTLLIVDKGDQNIESSESSITYYLVEYEGRLSLKPDFDVKETHTVLGKVLMCLMPPIRDDLDADDIEWD